MQILILEEPVGKRHMYVQSFVFITKYDGNRIMDTTLSVRFLYSSFGVLKNNLWIHFFEPFMQVKDQS